MAQNKFINFNQHTYDFEALEKELLENLGEIETKEDYHAIVNKSTGYYVARQTMDILKRLENNEEVALGEIQNLPEIQEAYSCVNNSISTILLRHREALQQGIAEKLEKIGSAMIDNNGWVNYNGKVRSDKRIDVIIGLPASGKSSTLVDPISQEFKSKIIDSDEAKKLLPEFNNGWGATIVHEESKKITDILLAETLEKGENIVYPIIGSDIKVLQNRFQVFKELGYDIYLHFNDVTRNKALGRMLRRFFEQGRFLDPALSFQYGNKVTAAYEQLKKEGDLINGYSKWSNDGPRGSTPILIESTTVGELWRAARAAGNRYDNLRDGNEVRGTHHSSTSRPSSSEEERKRAGALEAGSGREEQISSSKLVTETTEKSNQGIEKAGNEVNQPAFLLQKNNKKGEIKMKEQLKDYRGRIFDESKGENGRYITVTAKSTADIKSMLISMYKKREETDHQYTNIGYIDKLQADNQYKVMARLDLITGQDISKIYLRLPSDTSDTQAKKAIELLKKDEIAKFDNHENGWYITKADDLTKLSDAARKMLPKDYQFSHKAICYIEQGKSTKVYGNSTEEVINTLQGYNKARIEDPLKYCYISTLDPETKSHVSQERFSIESGKMISSGKNEKAAAAPEKSKIMNTIEKGER